MRVFVCIKCTKVRLFNAPQCLISAVSAVHRLALHRCRESAGAFSTRSFLGHTSDVSTSAVVAMRVCFIQQCL